MSTNETKKIWFAVWLTEFLLMFIINAFTLIIFARTLQLRKRSTYLIINLTVADLLIAAVSGPETILVFIRNKRPKKGFGVLYSIISDMCWIASLGNLVLISLERLQATLYPFRHYCLVGKRISDMCWIASLGNLVLISLERLQATLYPFRHYFLVGKRIYCMIIIFSWVGALTLVCVLHIIRMNDSALADRYPWIIYG